MSDDFEIVRLSLRGYRRQVDPSVEAPLIQPAAEALGRIESRLREAEEEKMVAVEIRRWAFKRMEQAEAECDQLREQYKALDRDFNECDSERDRLRKVIAADHGRQFDCEDDCPYLLALEGTTDE